MGLSWTLWRPSYTCTLVAEQAADMWNQLRREFLYAAERLEAEGLSRPRAHLLWRSFWASHQRFFRHMCMAAKVRPLVSVLH